MLVRRRAVQQTLRRSCGFFSPDHDISGQRNVSSLAVRGSVTAKGPGGRSSISGVTATVFGATGFLGRYVVQLLARSGSQVIVPYRCLEDEQRHLKLMGDLGQVVSMRFDIRDEESIARAMAKSNVVINLLGRDFETRNFGFEDINVTAPHRIAKAATAHGDIARLIHLSCLGASPSAPSKQHRTKAAGEAATLKAFPQATILRSAELVGTEDRLLNSWAILAKKIAAVPLINGGSTLLQPVHVSDVAKAVMAAALDDGSSCGLTYELGGPQVMSMRDLALLMFETIREVPHILSVPLPIAQLLTAPRELLLKRVPFPIPSPTMFTADYVASLAFDHVVDPNALQFSDLGLTPQPLHGVAIEHLFAYRTGGPQYGETTGTRSTGAGF